MTTAGARPGVLVKDWFDLFTFDGGDVTVECPDCEQQSQPVGNVYDAARWVQAHIPACEA